MMKAPSANAVSGPLAEVLAEYSGGCGYCCHPAVADNSMHIGILVGRDDGKTRIPGTATNAMSRSMSLKGAK